MVVKAFTIANAMAFAFPAAATSDLFDGYNTATLYVY